MIREGSRSLCEAREEAASVFALLLVEFTERPRVHKFVHEPTIVPPLATVFQCTNIPRERPHA